MEVARAVETQVTEGKRQWYVIHTFAGYEHKVKTNLEKRIASMGLADKVFRIVVPVEEQIEIKDGKKKTVKKKVFPGYVLVEMVLTDESWHAVRYTPGVTGFVGAGNKPVPLPESEVQAILQQVGVEEPRLRIDLELGEAVRVKAGPFEGFVGTVEEIDLQRGKVRVLVSMFGRETPLELDFTQLEKV